MRRPEEALHRQVAHFLKVAAPDLLWWHTPNGGARSKAEAGILKALGVRAGVPDICIVLPGGQFAGIELKAAKGSLTEGQAVFRDHCNRDGGCWAICRSLDDVIEVLGSWGVPLRSREAA